MIFMANIIAVPGEAKPPARDTSRIDASVLSVLLSTPPQGELG
jgi:hypothetical protein